VAQEEEFDIFHGGRSAISGNSTTTCRKIKYSNRNDTPGSCPTSDHRWSATPTRVLAPHRGMCIAHDHPLTTAWRMMSTGKRTSDQD
jgi:hypothetical protein